MINWYSPSIFTIVTRSGISVSSAVFEKAPLSGSSPIHTGLSISSMSFLCLLARYCSASGTGKRRPPMGFWSWLSRTSAQTRLKLFVPDILKQSKSSKVLLFATKAYNVFNRSCFRVLNWTLSSLAMRSKIYSVSPKSSSSSSEISTPRISNKSKRSASRSSAVQRVKIHSCSRLK